MIKIEHLSYTYKGAVKPAVDDISFEVKEGEIFGFLGPNGAGKSTTQRILTRILQDFKGKVSILGKSISDWNEAFYEQIGVGFEFPNFYSKLSAKENMIFFGSFYQKELIDLDRLFQMVGLEEEMEKKVGDYSKGMKVRLNFIRAIQHQPELLFLDEPTSGLDPVNQRLLRDLILQEKKKGKTIFLTTHNMVDAEHLCDRVAFIVDGKLAVIENPRELMIRESKRQIEVGVRNEGKIQTKLFPMERIGDNAEFLSLLKNPALETIHSKEATLEDVFIKLTGSKLGV